MDRVGVEEAVECRLSAEDIRNQKILLEYYKMQQEKKEKRKVEKSKKGKKRFVVCWQYVFLGDSTWNEKMDAISPLHF